MTDDIADSLRPKLVGARVLRVEDPRLLAGKGAYVDDHKIPGTLAVAFRRSDHAHARIAGIDTTAAQAMPGVAAVVSASDLEGAFTALRATSRMKNYHATDLLPLAYAPRCAMSASPWWRWSRKTGISPRTPPTKLRSTTSRLPI